MMSGLASGLRSIVWKVTPARPKLSPTRTARTARGSRSRPTVNDAPGTVSPMSTRQTSVEGVGGAPEDQAAHEGAHEQKNKHGDDDPATVRPGMAAGTEAVDSLGAGGCRQCVGAEADHSSRTRR